MDYAFIKFTPTAAKQLPGGSHRGDEATIAAIRGGAKALRNPAACLDLGDTPTPDATALPLNMKSHKFKLKKKAVLPRKNDWNQKLHEQERV